MSAQRRDLATQAVRAAGAVRRQYGVGLREPICAFDVAEALDLSVRLLDLPTLEGVYLKEERAILIGTQRPMGRRRYSCAHEIGHHIFGHGSRLHQFLPGSSSARRSAESSAEEFLANRFAAALLMPKLAVMSAFARRRWPLRTADGSQVFTIAQELGVGYSTLVDHLEITLAEVTSAKASALRKESLPAIRVALVGVAVTGDVVVVDESFERSAVDLETGDALIVPAGAIVNGSVLQAGGFPSQYVASRVGRGEIRLLGRKGTLSVRVGRPRFAGLARYRHLEEEE